MKKIVIIFLTFFTLQGFAQEVSKQYDKIGKFNKGLAIVWKNGHCGILSQDGREIVKPTYDKIGSFGNDAIAYTTRDGKVGLLNMEGKVIVPNIYESIGGFKGSFDAGYKKLTPFEKTCLTDHDIPVCSCIKLQ